MRLTIAMAAAALALAGCGSDNTTTGNGEPDGTISKATFDGKWPFTVDQGVLACAGAAVTFEADGEVWAVNGQAATEGFADIDPIWKDTGDRFAPKVNIGDVIDAGLALCG